MKKIAFLILLIPTVCYSQTVRSYDDFKRMAIIPVDTESYVSYSVNAGPVKADKLISDQEGYSFVNYLLTQNRLPRLKLSTNEPNYVFVESGLIIIYYDNEKNQFIPSFLRLREAKASSKCHVYEKTR